MSGGGQLRIRIPDVRLRELLQVVAEARVDRHVPAEAPFVLREEGILLDVRMRRRPGRARTGKRLNVARGLVQVERRQARERVGAEEVAGEVVQDVVELEVESASHLVRAARPGERVGDLPALDGRFARAERVAADGEDRQSALLNDRFRVRRCWLRPVPDRVAHWTRASLNRLAPNTVVMLAFNVRVRTLESPVCSTRSAGRRSRSSCR